MGPAAVVCVPARNEAECLPRLLRALDAQDGIDAQPGGRLRVVVVANNCTDGTGDAVRAMADLGRLDLRLIEVDLSPARAHVGTARRMALDAGADRLDAEGREDGVLLTTDADALPPPGWLAANLRALRRADVVGGRLVIDADGADPGLAALHARIERYWAGVRRLEDILDPPPHDPPPRHGDHTGASLALPAALYRAVGGLPALPCGEDNALVGSLRAAGARLRHCPDVSVRVSARVVGRVTGGMATEMARRGRAAQGGEAYRLPAAAHWHALIARRAALRRAWREGVADPVWTGLGVTRDDLAAVDPGRCANDIAFVERMAARLEARDGAAPSADLDDCLADLDALARDLRSAA